MAYIINNYFDRNRQLRFLDHGGGYGLLSAELLLNNKLPIIKAVNCDISEVNMMFAHRMFLHFRDKLLGRFFFHLGASEDFEYDESYDIISFIGSLLYIPKDKVLHTLTRSWEALRPGGILVIHENIKSPSYIRDYAVMFTVDELESLLTRFGTIDYYLSTATLRVNRKKVGTKSVFRVIRKCS
jgi:SAM-dependent methyltransferase